MTEDDVMPILELRGIDKHFSSVHALKSVSLKIGRGETIALVGENGAGKSTLMKILTGVYEKDKGDILIEGKKHNITSPLYAKKIGIGQVYQQAELIPELTAAENILIGEMGFSRKGLVNWKELKKRACAFIEKYQLSIDPDEKIKNMSVANRQLVSIVKVLQRNPKILIFDEPTAVFSNLEVSLLMSLIDQLKRDQITIIYISHRLEEVFKVADHIAIMRDGYLVSVIDNVNVKKEDLIQQMLGRKSSSMFPEKANLTSEEKILEVRNLSSEKIKNVSFSLRQGEILGIAGLVGSGRTELARAVYGLDRIKAGGIYIDAKEVKIRSPVDAVKHGLFLAPEDRRGEGLVLVRSIKNNIILSNFRSMSRHGVCHTKSENSATQALKDKLSIKADSIHTLVGNLSGGNQQKVIIAKALLASPRILIFDEPTQGIDVGAKSEIYALLTKMREEGMSIIFISSEIEELQGICTRIIVMRNGAITGEVESGLEDGEKILNLMYRS